MSARRAEARALRDQVAALTTVILEQEARADAHARAGDAVAARLRWLLVGHLVGARETLKRVRLGAVVLACRASARAVDDLGRVEAAERLGLDASNDAPEAAS